MLDTIERELLRSAYDAPVELSDACARVLRARAAPHAYDARDKVRLHVDAWLERGWVELYAGAAGARTVVPVGERTAVLDLETNWDRPDPGEEPIWFATTGAGRDAAGPGT